MIEHGLEIECGPEDQAQAGGSSAGRTIARGLEDRTWAGRSSVGQSWQQERASEVAEVLVPPGPQFLAIDDRFGSESGPFVPPGALALGAAALAVARLLWLGFMDWPRFQAVAGPRGQFRINHIAVGLESHVDQT
eukprot:g30572.t1